MKKRTKIILFSILAVVLLVIGGGAYYIVQSAPVSETELSQAEIDTFSFEKKEGYLYFQSDHKNARTGIIIYQGARFEPLNYSRIANELQKMGYDVFISAMPFNWAFFNINLAGDIIDAYPQIDNWFVGGHSLGGAMASSFVQKHDIDSIKGMFFLASYPVSDFSQTDIPMLYLFAENDGLVNEEDIKKAEANLSTSNANRVETIFGGNHSQFGNVKTQSGDNPATISGKEQQKEVVYLLDDWISGMIYTL